MIVLDVQNMGWSGNQVGTFNGHDVYYHQGNWNFVQYILLGRSSASGDMMDFINDAISRGYVDPSWYLHDMEAGFEIMRGGQGLECNGFSFSVSGGGTTSTTTTAATTSTTTTSATTTTTSGGGCDCGTCDWYGSNVPMCCESCSGWGWYDGGCRRSCVCPSSCEGGCVGSQCGGTTSTTTTAATTSTTTTAATTTTTTTAATTSTTTTAATTTTTAAAGCTCDSGCDGTAISPNFSQNGSGQYCWQATSGTYINSWNVAKLEVNDTDYTNKFVFTSSFPAKIDGVWYIYYNSSVPWGHFELNN